MFCTSHKFRKLECATQIKSPTRSEIQQCLGVSLGQVLLDYNYQEAVKPSSKLSQQSCCTSQDNRLKADTTETLTEQELLKLYLHKNILALGEVEVKKFQAEVEAATQKKLRDEFAEKCHMLDAEKTYAIKRSADEIHAKYEEYFNSAQEELKEKLQIELADVSAKHNAELKKAIAKARVDATSDALRKAQSRMDLVVRSLHDEFEQTCLAQKEKITADFNEMLKKQSFDCDAAIKDVKREKIKQMRIQHHKFKIQNIINIIYVFCIERLHSNLRMQAIRKYFETEIKSLHEFIAKQEETTNALKKEITKYRNKNKMLKEKINDLTKEFQKFINYAFNALPEHADFLLPLNLLSINSISKDDINKGKQKKIR